MGVIASNYVLSYTTDGGTTYTGLGILKSPSVGDGINKIDMSNLNDIDERIDLGRRVVTISTDIAYEISDDGYLFLRSAYDNRTAIVIAESIGGNKIRKATFYITKFDVNAPSGGELTGSLEFSRDGEWSVWS